MFTFQFPGQFLQQDVHTDTSAWIKPVVVNESELPLINQLYNVGEVVGTPNGHDSSTCYDQVLHNLVPSHENDSRIMERQQDWIRRWLMNDVPASGWVKNLVESQHKRSASLTAAVVARL